MTAKKTTHELNAETLVRPYAEPIHTTPQTTHDLQVARFTEQFRESETVAQLADLLTTSSDLKRQAVQSALAGDTK